MSSWLRTLLLCLMALSLPARGMAVAFMPCDLSPTVLLQQQVQEASPSMPPCHETAAGAGGLHKLCSVCACALVAVPAQWHHALDMALPQAEVHRAPHAGAAFVSHIQDHLDPPPKFQHS